MERKKERKEDRAEVAKEKKTVNLNGVVLFVSLLNV